jgi:hypothetical protein
LLRTGPTASPSRTIVIGLVIGFVALDQRMEQKKGKRKNGDEGD